MVEATSPGETIMIGARSIVATLICVFISGAAVAAEEAKPSRQISVSGTVEAKTAPDRIVWHISLRDTDKNLQEAKRRNDERVKAVLALRDKLSLRPATSKRATSASTASTSRRSGGSGAHSRVSWSAVA
jgi:hypothetical protein